jgi:hypothetical protein
VFVVQVDRPATRSILGQCTGTHLSRETMRRGQRRTRDRCPVVVRQRRRSACPAARAIDSSYTPGPLSASRRVPHAPALTHRSTRQQTQPRAFNPRSGRGREAEPTMRLTDTPTVNALLLHDCERFPASLSGWLPRSLRELMRVSYGVPRQRSATAALSATRVATVLSGPGLLERSACLSVPSVPGRPLIKLALRQANGVLLNAREAQK